MINARGTAPTRRGASVSASILVAVLLAAAAVPALGRPDFAAAGDFMTSGRPTRYGALAAVQLVVWALVVALFVWQFVHALRRASGIRHEMKRRRTRSRAYLALGLLLFTGGALHNQSQGASMCCGDVNKADLLLR